jgi:hypothetical protein
MVSLMQTSQDLSPFTPVLGGLAFIAFWISVNFLVSRRGWHAFAVRYPAATRPAGDAYGSPFMYFGSFRTHYNCIVKIVLSDAGVYFYPSVLARSFHHPFIVPWGSVKRIEKKDGFFWSRYRLDIEDPAGEIHFTLPLKAEHEVLKYHKTA